MHSPPPSSRFPQINRPQLVLLIVALTGLLSIMGWLAMQVQYRLASLERADSDNGQWVMMQTEVEVLRLQSAVADSRHETVPLDEVRRWYDVLYSRIDLLHNSQLYAHFITLPENMALITPIQDFLDRWQPTIDGPDQGLRAALPVIETESHDVQRDARTLSLNALMSFSDSTDMIRTRVSEALMGLAITAATTFVLLALVTLKALRLHRLSTQQAIDNQITGERLQMIITNSPDAIIVTNRSGWLVEFNPAAEQMFGWRRDQVIGHQIVPIIFAQENHSSYQGRLNRLITATFGLGPQRFELEGRRRNGSRFPVEISIASRNLDSDSLIVGFFRDVSERKANQMVLENALSQARAGEKAKAEFLAVMSHEMRTPLNGLIGAMELLESSILTADQRELMRAMEISGDILLGHVNSVLDISRIEAGEIRLIESLFDLDRLIEDCITNQTGLAKAGGNRIRYAPLDGNLGMVRGDTARVRQILLNLIGNAVKFTRDGEITIEAERLPQPRNGSKAMIELRVSDTGIGIGEDDQERIFEDFERLDSSYGRQAGGTGLGLGIARRLADAMGGEIGVESELGEGSLFWLRLPLPEALAPPEPQIVPTLSVPAPPPVADPLDILIIEDNEINRFLLRRQLQEAGHRVIEASDGLEGVAQAQARQFDLILTDISMPHLDGIEATRQIRAFGASSGARIVALTAHALPAEFARFHQAGMDACLTKPITRERLLSELQTQIAALKGQPPPDQGADPPPPAAPSELPAQIHIDDIEKALEDRLQDLRAQLDPTTLSELIGKFIHEADAVIALIPSPLNAAQLPAGLSARLHRLAGTASVFGALPLQRTLSAAETALNNTELERSLYLLQILQPLWHLTRTLLKRHQATLGA